jgi:predicted nucleic acid-binding protein
MQGLWVCVDANMVIRLVADPRDQDVNRLWAQWDSDGKQIAAPALLHYEVTNALYRYQRHGLLSGSSVRLALQAAFSLPINLHAEPGLHWQALEWADRLSLPAVYDAHYVAVAANLGAELWTTDKRLVQAAQPTSPWVRLLGE